MEKEISRLVDSIEGALIQSAQIEQSLKEMLALLQSKKAELQREKAMRALLN